MKVFSFCLYGSNPKYTLGMIENIKIINEKFSEWYIYIYYDDVPSIIIEQINTFKNIRLIHSIYTGAKRTLERFNPIDDTNVEIMIVRDADSRIHNRDIWTINQFIKSDKQFHIIRDHIWHRTTILAGLWGIKQGLLKFNIEESIKNYVNRCENKWQVDQIYLNRFIYPIIKNDVLIHGSLKMYEEEIVTPFPCPVKNDDFCGQVIDYKNNIPYRVFNLKGFV
jgi:hypothetical protein